jgi:hypothetical protein
MYKYADRAEGSAESEVTLSWEAVTVDPSLSVPGFTLVGLETQDCTESTSVGMCYQDAS